MIVVSVALPIFAAAALSLLFVSSSRAALELHYLRKNSTANAGSQTKHDSPACGNGESTVSGGARPSAFGLAINSTYPLQSLNRWRVYYDNNEKDAEVSTYAICANRDPVIRTKTESSPGRHFISPRCPLPPMEPTGGGVFSAGGFQSTLLEEQGAESSEDHTPRGNWNTVVRGFELTDSVTVTGYSVCTNVGQVPRYPTNLFSDQSGPGWGRNSSHCRRTERAVGGGGFRSGLVDDPAVYLSGSYPIDTGADADHVPDNGWRVQMESNSSVVLDNVWAFAVCVDA